MDQFQRVRSLFPIFTLAVKLSRAQAIKKVRAIQRLRRNRGFAFSQSPNEDGLGQEKLIRSYDTTLKRPEG